MPNAYIYQADIYCEPCGKDICDDLIASGNLPNEDSDHYPQGPYPNGGGEADCPQHCATCHTFLENPLTSEGLEYLKEQIRRHPNSASIREECEFYGLDPLDCLDHPCEECR